MNHSVQVEKLEEQLQYRFDDPKLLQHALVHRSFVHENPQLERMDNETLEFLGDAVLSLAISRLLLERFPEYREGDLSRLRSSIVNERELAKVASSLNLGDYLLLGKGEEMTGGRLKPSLLADCLEALFAAIYLDRGMKDTITVVEALFHKYLDSEKLDHPLKALDKDYKTQLQELSQARFKQAPVYYLEAEEGPDHDKTFHMIVTLEGRVVARGFGKSKKEAQQIAAEAALEQLGSETSLPLNGG
ncbi:MAG: ribonuclease III [Syntrophobacteraceae bacterium]